MLREPRVIGWDIGGAHVKASLLDGGRLLDAAQWPAAIWCGLDRLDAALDEASRRWPDIDRAAHAVTMSAEMTDLFADREAGVAALVTHLSERLSPSSRYFAGEAGWLAPEAACRAWPLVASANWLASAEWVAIRCRDALLVDVGTTTTDLIPVRAGRAAPSGRSDGERLGSGELVYLGIVRTPLCALAQRIRWQGRLRNVMNEFFATSADVFRLAGLLDERHDQHPAADGGAKDLPGSARRLARMIGQDGRDAPLEAWRDFAAQWVHRIERRIQRDATRVALAAGLPGDAPVVGAGCGSFLARNLARRLNRPFVPFHRLLDAPEELQSWADTCAPSAAIAQLYLAGERRCG